MSRVLWLSLALVVVLAAWWSHYQLMHGMRMGDVIAYNVLLVTALVEGGIWGFAYWWHNHDSNTRAKNLRDMKAYLALLRRTKRPSKTSQKAF